MGSVRSIMMRTEMIMEDGAARSSSRGLLVFDDLKSTPLTPQGQLT